MNWQILIQNSFSIKAIYTLYSNNGKSRKRKLSEKFKYFDLLWHNDTIQAMHLLKTKKEKIKHSRQRQVTHPYLLYIHSIIKKFLQDIFNLWHDSLLLIVDCAKNSSHSSLYFIYIYILTPQTRKNHVLLFYKHAWI